MFQMTVGLQVLQPEEANKLESVFLSSDINVRLGVSLAELEPKEVGQIGERGCTLIRGRGPARVVLGRDARPRDIYKVAASALLGADQPGLVDKLEGAGWDLSILALPTCGYTFTSNS